MDKQEALGMMGYISQMINGGSPPQEAQYKEYSEDDDTGGPTQEQLDRIKARFSGDKMDTPYDYAGGDLMSTFDLNKQLDHAKYYVDRASMDKDFNPKTDTSWHSFFTDPILKPISGYKKDGLKGAWEGLKTGLKNTGYRTMWTGNNINQELQHLWATTAGPTRDYLFSYLPGVPRRGDYKDYVKKYEDYVDYDLLGSNAAPNKIENKHLAEGNINVGNYGASDYKRFIAPATDIGLLATGLAPMGATARATGSALRPTVSGLLERFAIRNIKSTPLRWGSRILNTAGPGLFIDPMLLSAARTAPGYIKNSPQYMFKPKQDDFYDKNTYWSAASAPDFGTNYYKEFRNNFKGKNIEDFEGMDIPDTNDEGVIE